MARSWLVVLLVVLANACASTAPPPVETGTPQAPPTAPPPADAAAARVEPSSDAHASESSPPSTDAGAAPVWVEVNPTAREALARAVTTAAPKLARGEIDAGLQILESATKDMPVPPLAYHHYPRGAVRELAFIRELTSALREALEQGGGGVPVMDALDRVYFNEVGHPLEPPLYEYAMRVLEQETRTAPEVAACESAVRWLRGLGHRGGRPPPYALDLHRRFRHRLVCNQPCNAPRPSC